MQLDIINDILQTVQNAGINEVILEKIDGGIKIRGVDSLETMLVYSECAGDIIPSSFGIHRVPTLLSRMKLFDFSKAKAKIAERTISVDGVDETFVSELSITMGHRKVSFTGARPSTIKAPSGLSETELVNKISLSTNEDVPMMVDAMSAFGSPTLITIAGTEDDIFFKISDEVSDGFVDVIGTNSGGEWSYNYRRDNFQRLIKQASKNSEVVDIGITKRGLMYIIVNDITFVMIPQVE